jgi:mono/diheme cytochrome c family protein
MVHLRKWALGVVGVVLAAQLIRPSLTNPPVVAEPHWNDARTRALVRGACFDCHSNETVVPWYGQVAPFRWLMASHVNEGRENMNFSDPASEYDLESMVKEIRHGGMPLWDYKLIHPRAQLTLAQRDSLISGLRATFADPKADEDSAIASTGKPAAEALDEHGEKENEDHR